MYRKQVEAKRKEVDRVLHLWKLDQCLYSSEDCTWQSPREEGLLCSCEGDHYHCLSKRLSSLGVMLVDKEAGYPVLSLNVASILNNAGFYKTYPLVEVSNG